MDKIKKLLTSEDFSKLIRFCITGGLNTAVDFLIYAVLTTWAGIGFELAHILSYSAGMVNSYCVNRSWTFQTRERFFSKELLRFAVVNIIILILSTFVLDFLTKTLLLHYLVAKLCTIGFTLILGFVFNRLVVFH